MLYVIQTIANPNKLYIVKAESRLTAMHKAGLVDVSKKIWYLQNCIIDTIVEDLHVIELD